MTPISKKPFVFTGWHMLVVMCLFFGTIISVNFYMAWQATHTWSGLVVKNTYIASQEFNGKVAEAKALAASGVTGKLDVDSGEIRYRIDYPAGHEARADALTMTFKRPVGEEQDFSLFLQPAEEGLFSIKHALPSGAWIIEANATENGRRILHHTERLMVPGAAQ